MFRKVEDFQQNAAYNSKATQKLLDVLTDASLKQEVSPGHWNLGTIAWHIVKTIPEMCGRTGLKVDGPAEDASPPATAVEIQEAYRSVSDQLLEQVAANWDDNTLLMTDDLYGEQWERGKTLAILLHHEAHHRGQLTVLMRQAGLTVPGVYGPAKEEWKQFGMAEPAN